MPPRADRWSDALAAAALAVVDPAGLGGVALRARHGPVRERWLDAALSLLPSAAPRRRIAATVETARLLGGLDFAATLNAGRSVMETGVLPAVSGGALTVAMAERLPSSTAAVIAGALDRGCVRIEREGFSAELAARFVLFALDEGLEDEALPAALGERLAFTVELEGLRSADTGPCAYGPAEIEEARRRLLFVEHDHAIQEALTMAAMEAGFASPRIAIQLSRAARAAAALEGAARVRPEHAVTAVRLVLGIAVASPEPAEAPRDEAAPAEALATDSDEAGDGAGGSLAETIVAAAAATLPPGLLDLGMARRRREAGAAAGRAGEAEASGTRGRAVGIVAGRPAREARIDLLATMRAAAPWQTVRRRAKPQSPVTAIRVAAEDFRYVRRRQKQGATAIFVVDASGSAAAARLAETKGAVEHLLAECYVRRDEVALIAFRRGEAELMLEPTRSLVRAKRSLAGMPGGGPTPLAHGVAAATRLAASLDRRGRRTMAVFLTDGRGNVALDGGHGRERAMSDAVAAARRFRALGLRGVVIDTGMRAQPALESLAGELGADYVALPRGGAQRISAELAARLRE